MPRIMVVDDDPDIRVALVDALRRAGYDVVGAPDASSALLSMREARPDVLITDVRMPYTDGWALIRGCRADPVLADVPVIVMSGAVSMRPIAVEHGATAFLLKPFSWSVAVQAVTTVLSES